MGKWADVMYEDDGYGYDPSPRDRGEEDWQPDEGSRESKPSELEFKLSSEGKIIVGTAVVLGAISTIGLVGYGLYKLAECFIK